MKKAFLVLLTVMLIISLVGCNQAAGIYNQANEAFQAGDYSKAIELLDTIPEYEKADDLKNQTNAFLDFATAEQNAEKVNTEIDNVIRPAQNLLESGKTPFDETTISPVEKAISSLQEEKIEIRSMPDDTNSIMAEVERMKKLPDYTEKQTVLQNAQKALENSIKQMEQVTNPSGDFVKERLARIESVGEIACVTEENDPNGQLNKPGGYTAAVIFESALVNQAEVYGSDLIEKGTLAGGCIEVYQTVENAMSRDTYLAAFDGSVLCSGSHIVLGTIVIRASDNLTATQQKELTEQITNILLELQ